MPQNANPRRCARLTTRFLFDLRGDRVRHFEKLENLSIDLTSPETLYLYVLFLIIKGIMSVMYQCMIVYECVYQSLWGG